MTNFNAEYLNNLVFTITGYRLLDRHYLLHAAGISTTPSNMSGWRNFVTPEGKHYSKLLDTSMCVYNATRAHFKNTNSNQPIHEWHRCPEIVKHLLVLKVLAAITMTKLNTNEALAGSPSRILDNFMIDAKRSDGWTASEVYDPNEKTDTWICKLSNSQHRMDLCTIFDATVNTALVLKNNSY